MNEIAKRNVIHEEVERSISWLYNNITGHPGEKTLKKVMLNVLFISTSELAGRLSIEQYKIILMSAHFYKDYVGGNLSLYVHSFLDFVERLCRQGLTSRINERTNLSVPRDVLNEIIDFRSSFSAEIQHGADEIFEAEKDVFVLNRLLRERKAILHLRHNHLRVLLQKKEALRSHSGSGCHLDPEYG